MWPDVPVNSIWLLTLRGLCFGQRIINTFGYQVTALTGAEKPVDEFSQAFWADADWADFKDDFLNCLPEDYTLMEAWLQYIYPFRVRKSVLEVDENGAIAAPALVQSQASISRHAVEASRRSNGGIRLIMPEGSAYSTQGMITNTHKTTLGILALEMDDQIGITVDGSSYTLSPVIIHPGATPGSYSATRVVATNVQDQLRTQRTRVVGRGE